MKRILPPTYFLTAVALMAALHFLLPGCRLVGFPWSLVGLLPMALGIFLNLSADRSFKTHRTPVRPFERSDALVTGGVFQFSRNPMYLGMAAILAGIALLLGSATPWIVVVAMAVLLDRVFIRAEEAMLIETFGEEYRQYQRRVRRWI